MMKTQTIKFLILFMILILASEQGFSQTQEFITTWEVTTSDLRITIPTTGTGYNYAVDWGDGNATSAGQTGDASHTYTTAGTYTVRITGNFPRIYFNNGGDKDKIKTIEQWGDIQWESMENAFFGCGNLSCNAVDLPDLSDVTSTRFMFSKIKQVNGNISNWDVSHVTDMSSMFASVLPFNQDISNWDVSHVTDMSSMFSGALAFNQAIGNWNVSNVTNMARMFQHTWEFNQDISGWNVSSVTNMSSMFGYGKAFDQDIDSWDVSNVTDMHFMFIGTPFNQNISSWDVSNVTDMRFMFAFASSFNQDINNWNVSNVTNMHSMFREATAFNGNITDWNVSNVTKMVEMFHEATAFNGAIGDWNVSNVVDMGYMFFKASSFNQDINNWDVSNVTNMDGMFREATVFNGAISNWNVSNVTSMSGMFYEAYDFDQPIGAWNISNVVDMSYMFLRASSFNQDINNWDVSNVTNMENMFRGASTFNSTISNWNVSNVISMLGMFYDASDFNQDIGTWNVSNVVVMNFMFLRASSFNQDISNWNVSEVTGMNRMFWSANIFNQDIGNWDVSKVTDMNSIFEGANSFNQSLAHWDITRVNSIFHMLDHTNLSIENYDATLTAWANLDLQSNLSFGAEEVQYCSAVDARNKLINDFGWQITDDGRNCPFDFTGVVFHDINQNKQQDAGEYGLGNQKVMLLPDSCITLTDQAGNYHFTVPEGNYEVVILPSQYYELSTDSSSYQISFPEDEGQSYPFGLKATQTIYDVSSSLTSSPTRCGVTVPFWLSYQNNGTVITDGKVKLIPDIEATYVSSSQPFSTNGDTLIWDYSDLKPNERRQIELSFEMPGVNAINDTLTFVHLIEAIANDTLAFGFTDTFSSEIRCAYDPNDKTATPIGLGDDHLTRKDEFLEYRIRFQNTGNDTAFNVIIRDTLQADLELSTLEVIASSHSMRTQLDVQDGALAFHFENILLPDSVVDEPNSHGFVTFRIKPKTGLSDSTEILNTAYIYFDFNPAIQTNYTLNTLVDKLPLNTDTTLVLSTCDSYTAPDNQVYTTSGIYTAVIPNTVGCDSTITIDLTIKSSSSSEITQTACDSYTAPDNQIYTSTGIYTAVIPNTVGCDSTITIDLTIKSSSSSEITLTACDSYTAPDNQVYTTSGIYTAVIPNTVGCDSTITIDLTIKSSSSSEITLTACDSYIAPDNQVYTSTGIYTAVIPNTVGCDSTITIDLTIKSSSSSEITQTACDSYTAPDNQIYTTSGIYTAVIPNTVGCDSTITIDLTINKVDTTVTLNGGIITATLSGATYQWLDCNTNYAIIPDSTRQSFIASENGVYAVEITSNGCVGTSACIEITTVGIRFDPIFDEVKVYPNPTKGLITIDLGDLESALVRVYSYDGKLVMDQVAIDRNKNSFELNERSGVYLVEINSKDSRRVYRIFKQ